MVFMIRNYSEKKGITIHQAMEELFIPKNEWDYYASKCKEELS